MSGPPEYDPRRLFPFGLSPIPEVPSELASEVSSMYSYNPDDEEESEAETEIEGTKTPGSIMYSGSCSSVKRLISIWFLNFLAAGEAEQI